MRPYNGKVLKTHHESNARQESERLESVQKCSCMFAILSNAPTRERYSLLCCQPFFRQVKPAWYRVNRINLVDVIQAFLPLQASPNLLHGTWRTRPSFRNGLNKKCASGDESLNGSRIFWRRKCSPLLIAREDGKLHAVINTWDKSYSNA